MPDRSARGRAGRRRGADRELRVRDYFRKQGKQAHKTSRSEVVDVIVIEPHCDHCATAAYPQALVLYVEVKGTRHPYERFGPAQRAALREAAAEAGARPLLFHWPKNVSITNARQIPAEEWPT